MTPGADDATVERLGAVPLFSSLSKKELKAVAGAGAVQAYRANDRIVAKGDKGIGFYLVLDGRVEVRADGKVLAALGPGNFFGELALFEEQRRSADVVAVAPSRCLVLSRWEFWGEMTSQPEVLRGLMAELVRRLRATSNALSE